MIIPSRQYALPWAIGAVAGIVGAIVAFHYHQLGLTLSHYDARGHLVVARRIIDSITPGWQQIGAVWLPLPHLLNVLPVQNDWFYRIGVSAVALSIFSFALATGAIARIVITRGTSRPFFRSMRSNAIATLEPGDPLLSALTSVTWPMIFVFRGTAIWPCTNRALTILVSTLSFALHLLVSSRVNSSTVRRVPGTGVSVVAEF